MKTFSHFQVIAGVSCALALAACDSIKDVANPDAATLPPQTVVLSGQIHGLSSLRAITPATVAQRRPVLGITRP